MIAKFKKNLLKWVILAVVIFAAVGCSALTSSNNIDIGKSIDEKLHIIVSNPKVQMSSNPYDYINAEKKAYDEIVNMDKPALTYLLAKFEKGSGNGLEEWVMAKACSDILGDKNPVKTWSSGRDWYLGYTGKQLVNDVNYYFEIDDINKLFDAYHDKLDGAYAEGYGSSLVKLYSAGDIKVFIKTLSNYPKDKIDGITRLFVGELFIEGKQAVIQDFEKMKTDKSLTSSEVYVIDKILSFSKELEAKNVEALNSVSKEIDEIKPERNEEVTIDKSEKYFFEKPQSSPGSTLIKVFKSARILELYGDGKLIGRFKIALGRAPQGDKTREGDAKTPEGKYYVCSRNDRSNFKLFLGLSYPNIKDAKKGLQNGLIDRQTFDTIKRAQERKLQPPWDTPLGGIVGIHGGGNDYDWTLGCIALSDEDIGVLWQYAPLKTPVEIYQ